MAYPFTTNKRLNMTLKTNSVNRDTAVKLPRYSRIHRTAIRQFSRKGLHCCALGRSATNAALCISAGRGCIDTDRRGVSAAKLG